MSRVYFHSPSADNELSGIERHYAAVMTHDLAIACLRSTCDRRLLERMVPSDSPIISRGKGMLEDDWWTMFSSWLQSSFSDSYFYVGDKRYDGWMLTLNTALVAGSDAVKWLTYLHASCEIHGYVEGPHRAWLAGIIEQGRKDRVLRADVGWEGVINLLRLHDDEPVVMSYSVTAQFPNHDIAGWKDACDGDDWYKLPEAEQWDRALTALRWQRGLDLHPDMWGTRGFGGGESFFDLAALARKEIWQ